MTSVILPTPREAVPYFHHFNNHNMISRPILYIDLQPLIHNSQPAHRRKQRASAYPHYSVFQSSNTHVCPAIPYTSACVAVPEIVGSGCCRGKAVIARTWAVAVLRGRHCLSELRIGHYACAGCVSRSPLPTCPESSVFVVLTQKELLSALTHLGFTVVTFESLPVAG
jgi:hypothetical protein